MKQLAIFGMCALLSACASTGGGGAAAGGGQSQAEALKKVPGASSTVTGKREVLKATVNKKEIVAVLSWRDYSAKLDGAVTKWYGDMASPPPKFVVESLLVSIDGRGMIVLPAKTRYLASQVMNEVTSLSLYKQGGNYCISVDLGDGAEAWTASYVINPTTLTLVSHQVEDGPTFHNAIAP